MLVERSIGVIDGQLVGDESWVYVWLKDREILYVGATRLPLGARTWLHLTDDDPAIGKIRAHHPEAMKGTSRYGAGSCPAPWTGRRYEMPCRHA